MNQLTAFEHEDSAEGNNYQKWVLEIEMKYFSFLKSIIAFQICAKFGHGLVDAFNFLFFSRVKDSFQIHIKHHIGTILATHNFPAFVTPQSYWGSHDSFVSSDVWYNDRLCVLCTLS